MVQSFKSPLFSGIGFSSHELTVENLARTRKQALKDQAKAEAETAKVTASSTPLNNFINNLQARIYSQLASQVTDAILMPEVPVLVLSIFREEQRSRGRRMAIWLHSTSLILLREIQQKFRFLSEL